MPPFTEADREALRPILNQLPAHQWTPWAWCPLLGGFPNPEEPATSPAMRAMALIQAARSLWGLELQGVPNRYGVPIWPGVCCQGVNEQGLEQDYLTDCPPPDLIERQWDYPARALTVARAVFNAEILDSPAFLSWRLATYRQQTSLADLKTAELDMALKATADLVSIVLKEGPPHWQAIEPPPVHCLLALFAIKEAAKAFKQGLLEGDFRPEVVQTVSGPLVIGRPMDDAVLLLGMAQEQAAAGGPTREAAATTLAKAAHADLAATRKWILERANGSLKEGLSARESAEYLMPLAEQEGLALPKSIDTVIKWIRDHRRTLGLPKPKGGRPSKKR